MTDARLRLGTRAVHGAAPEAELGAGLEPALVLSNAYHLGTADDAAAAFRGEHDRPVYGRWKNPTVAHLERRLADLEDAEAAVATASGMAAVSGALLISLTAGDHVVAPLSCYGETSRLLREYLPRFGIQTTFVDGSRITAYAQAVTERTRVLYAETPSNPMLKLCDVHGLSLFARQVGARVICDNTFATPVHQRPLTLGADIVVHSMTKALGGHGDAIGGVMCGSAELMHQASELVVKGLGGVLAPFNALLIARGLSTLALRQRQASASALELAEWLSTRAELARVYYPGLPDHPGHAIAERQMDGYGALLSFELRGGYEAARQLVERVRLFSHAVSLGDVRSLIVHPASTTASTMPRILRERADIGDGLVRLSIGIEDVGDLRRDLEAALASVR
ncbi:MAG: aminotransferase class I/II-fold pyridoxal phosphate-dependent enzyme [Polyangiaceae bacterium]|nr:aminotransferase class I/II-fold pyridoxal phosphate-dependent enzyme [Polyangiaceae bacterium]MCW5790693.1 aminotransferase class I/II-fold pyridoxal phosphate-dependent enzyme [Polyangiaceae bacterium]